MGVLLSFYRVPGSIIEPVERIRLNILIEIESKDLYLFHFLLYICFLTSKFYIQLRVYFFEGIIVIIYMSISVH